MTFAVITHVIHLNEGNQFMAYAPYVREMNLWFKHIDRVEVVAPLGKLKKTDIDLAYSHKVLRFNPIPKIEFISVYKTISSLLKLPIIIFRIYRVCKIADHIHLRCPGNIGLLGCFVQMFFPSKPKTAKYAGNWDPSADQPWSYKLQRWILSNTWLTKNMRVLVYGDWEESSKNVIPFFTASFTNKEKIEWTERDYSKTIKFMFVGGLVEGKRPLVALKIVEELAKDYSIQLDVYGDGPLKPQLLSYVNEHNLSRNINFHGEVNLERLKSAYAQSHFIILASKSEGWPKAIAEAMFFGVIPIATKISCVPYMLHQGERGLLIDSDVHQAVIHINKTLQEKDLNEMSRKALNWSQQYTLDYFESEIHKQLLK